MPRGVAVLKFVGGRELDRALERFPLEVQRTLLRRAVVRASQPAIATAKALVPKRFGLLIEAIGLKSKFYRNTGTAVTVIGARGGDKFTYVRQGQAGESVEKPSKYAHLVEFGTKPHKQKVLPVLTSHGIVRIKGGMHPGAKPKPFLAPAFESNVQRMINIQGTVLAQGIAKIAARLARKR